MIIRSEHGITSGILKKLRILKDYFQLTTPEIDFEKDWAEHSASKVRARLNLFMIYSLLIVFMPFLASKCYGIQLQSTKVAVISLDNIVHFMKNAL